MAEETISTRILRTQRERLWKILGYPPKMKIEEYVQAAVEEKLNKDERTKPR